MKTSSSCSAGLRCLAVVMVAALVLNEQAQVTEAQGRCDPVELSWCLQSIVSDTPPTATCCQKLKGQEPCLCRETADPTFGGYLGLPAASKVAAACGVRFPNC